MNLSERPNPQVKGTCAQEPVTDRQASTWVKVPKVSSASICSMNQITQVTAVSCVAMAQEMVTVDLMVEVTAPEKS